MEWHTLMNGSTCQPSLLSKPLRKRNHQRAQRRQPFDSTRSRHPEPSASATSSTFDSTRSRHPECRSLKPCAGDPLGSRTSYRCPSTRDTASAFMMLASCSPPIRWPCRLRSMQATGSRGSRSAARLRTSPARASSWAGAERLQPHSSSTEA